ncbi:MAG TPA: hypothetical protein VFQ51_11585 [Vicinamibacteria bacterium]|nr:hypothetical protein [Vicinamibacteria bacterium]
MRAIARVVTTVATVLSLACGTYHPSRPPSSGLSLAASFDPDATGGVRAATKVTSWVVLDPPVERAHVVALFESAESTVYDGTFAVLARQRVVDPELLMRDGGLTVSQVLDWEPAHAVGRVLTIRFSVRRLYGAPEEGPLVIERAITF